MERHIPTEQDGKQALRDHVAEKALAARARYGPAIGPAQVPALLKDPSVVRYPVEIVFGADGLQPGEFAFAQQIGEHPRDGFRLWVHPWFEPQPGALPLLIAYHIPSINYGDVATAADCEVFAAALLGMERERYYATICELADSIPPTAG